MEISQNLIPTDTLGENYTLEDVGKMVHTNICLMKSAFKSTSSTAKVIAKLQQCPCLFKCAHEIKDTTYSNIDPLYSAKHEYAKTKIIDAIVDRFSDLVSISSEHNIPNGKLDIVIVPGTKIILKYNKKIIAIELKSGKSADASMLYQIERYLPDCDILIFVRIPTEEVTLIEKEKLKTCLRDNMSRLNRKITRLTKGQLLKVQGDWCRGCNAECTYKQPPRWSGESKASLENFGTFMQSIDNVITKLLSYLEKELGI